MTDPSFEHTQTTLERFKYAAQTYYTNEMAQEFGITPDVQLHSQWNFGRDEILLLIRQDIFGKQLEKVAIKYPSDWWQAVKDRWAPEWVRRRWPVHYVRYNLDVKALYPTIPDVHGHPWHINVVYKEGGSRPDYEDGS